MRIPSCFFGTSWLDSFDWLLAGSIGDSSNQWVPHWHCFTTSGSSAFHHVERSLDGHLYLTKSVPGLYAFARGRPLRPSHSFSDFWLISSGDCCCFHRDYSRFRRDYSWRRWSWKNQPCYCLTSHCCCLRLWSLIFTRIQCGQESYALYCRLPP